MSQSNFKPVPPLIGDFLSQQDAGHHTFITHIDQTSLSDKQDAFRNDLIINAVFAALLAWRLLSAASTYRPLLAPLLPAPARSAPAPAPRPWIWFLTNGAIDNYAFRTLAPATWRFFTGEALHRWRRGFRAEEIVFRAPAARGAPQDADALYRAIDRGLVERVPGARTGSEHWAVDFGAMAAAEAAAARGAVDARTWELSVWEHDGSAWSVWEVWRIHDPQNYERFVPAFKAKLEALGKGELFEQYLKIITQEMIAPDGTRRPGSEDSNKKAEEFFANEGLDLAKLLLEVQNELGIEL